MTSQLSLAMPNPEHAAGRREIRRMAGDPGNATVLSILRRYLRERCLATGEPVSADTAWEYLRDRPNLLALLTSTNALGSLFVAPGWKAVGFTRSRREGSHGNLLYTWTWIGEGTST